MLALRPLQAAVKQDFGEHFEVGLLDHIDTMGMWGFQGNDNDSTKLALMDSIVRFGKIKGTSVLDLQVGAFGNVTRLAGERRFPNWISGAQLRVDTLVRGWTLLSEPLAFLSAIEHGLVVYRDSVSYTHLTL